MLCQGTSQIGHSLCSIYYMLSVNPNNNAIIWLYWNYAPAWNMEVKASGSSWITIVKIIRYR